MLRREWGLGIYVPVTMGVFTRADTTLIRYSRASKTMRPIVVRFHLSGHIVIMLLAPKCCRQHCSHLCRCWGGVSTVAAALVVAGPLCKMANFKYNGIT